MVERGQILVVDDDPGVREPACAWLHAAGLVVHGAATAGGALALILVIWLIFKTSALYLKINSRIQTVYIFNFFSFLMLY